MADLISYQQLNAEVQTWTPATRAALLRRLQLLKVKKSGKLISSVSGRVSYSYGVASRIGFKFLRYGVFQEKGVGRGHPIESVKGNGEIIANAGSKGRVAKPWFNPVMDERVELLGNIVAAQYADIAIKNIRIK